MLDDDNINIKESTNFSIVNQPNKRISKKKIVSKIKKFLILKKK